MPCMVAPASASAAPTRAAVKTRGRRTWLMMLHCTSVAVAPIGMPICCKTIDAVTPTGTSTAPIAIVTTKDRKSNSASMPNASASRNASGALTSSVLCSIFDKVTVFAKVTVSDYIRRRGNPCGCPLR